MNLFPADQKRVDEFFESIASQRSGYCDVSFAYLALKQGDRFQLVRGRLYYNALPSVVPFSHFESATVRAGQYKLSELAADDGELLQKILTGEIDTPQGPLFFPSSESGRYATSFVALAPEAVQAQRRVGVLTILGAKVEERSTLEVDWELKAADVPYDSLQELMTEYTLHSNEALSSTTVEFIASNVAAIDGQQSTIVGDQATVHVVLANGFDQSRFSLAYRIYRPEGPIVRIVAKNTDFSWSMEPNQQRGVMTIKVPVGAVLNCVPRYKGMGQTHYWLIDPTRSQNPRRAVHEAFDPHLETVRDIVQRAIKKGQEARDLESAVAWLLWMLGFSVAQLGGIPRTQDAADLVAVAPHGHFAVIECTVGLLKADNKLPLLHDRAQAVRRALEASQHNYLRVLPVIVTSKSRDEIRPDIEQAERLGILIVTKETLERAIERTARLPAADQLFEEGWQEVQIAQSKHAAKS